jgi:hypothetical protein
MALSTAGIEATSDQSGFEAAVLAEAAAVNAIQMGL